jgi:hypothetical protein
LEHQQKLNEQRRKRIERTAEILETLPEKLADRKRALEERSSHREERVKRASEKVETFVQEKAKKTLAVVNSRGTKTLEMQEAAKKAVIDRAISEKKILEKRNAAAEQIFEKNREKLRIYEKSLEARDIGIQQRIDERDRQLADRLSAARVRLDEKSESIRQAQRAHQNAVAFAIAQKQERNSAGLKEASEMRAKSEIAIWRGKAWFAAKKQAVLELWPKVLDMDEQGQKKAVMGVLGVSEEEAQEIVEIAKSRTSLY